MVCSVGKGIDDLHKNLKILVGESVTRGEVIQVLSQHVTLSKVFAALFQGDYESHNPVARELDRTMDNLQLKDKLDGLDDFYNEALRELKLATTRVARQNFIRKLYENFYKSLDPKEQAKHGIVFTPIEVVDFIVKSTSYLLKEKFGVDFGDRNVNVIDPFTGTGSFIVRLLELGLIPGDKMYNKYKNELYANDIKLLSYYVAAVNIETTYASLRRGGKYVEFPGMCYTDTFAISPDYRGMSHAERAAVGVQSGLDGHFQAAHDMVRRQRGSHIHVVMGNPPYKADIGIKYGGLDGLDGKIKDTYESRLHPTEKKNTKLLYDSYIRALRWASNRIGGSGIVAFVTNGSFIRSGIGTGIRASLEHEFSEIWCFDLRGDQNTQGELSKREGGKIFDSKSKQPVAITFLLKIPGRVGCKIFYKDIGDRFERKQKLDTISKHGSIENIKKWQAIEPDDRHDWIDKVKKNGFFDYFEMGNTETKSETTPAPCTIFKLYSAGVKTACDAATYNFDKNMLSKNMMRHIGYCKDQDLDNWVDDKTKTIKDSMLVDRLKRFGCPPFNATRIRRAAYRPFFDQYLYFDTVYNQNHYLMGKFAPSHDHKNLFICVPTKIKGNFSVIVTKHVPDLHIIGTGQCFPLYSYNADTRIDNITDYAQNTFQTHYKNFSGVTIQKIDIFDYVYAILHHQGYRNQFDNNLRKYMPRIPLARNFWAFKNAGTSLRKLHMEFDKCPRAKLGRPRSEPKEFTKIVLKKSPDKKTVSVHANNNIIFKNIRVPRYMVNGRTPLEWVTDQYQKTVKHGTWINDPCASINIIHTIERAVYIGQRTDELVDTLPDDLKPSDGWILPKRGLDEHFE